MGQVRVSDFLTIHRILRVCTVENSVPVLYGMSFQDPSTNSFGYHYFLLKVDRRTDRSLKNAEQQAGEKAAEPASNAVGYSHGA